MELAIVEAAKAVGGSFKLVTLVVEVATALAGQVQQWVSEHQKL